MGEVNSIANLPGSLARDCREGNLAVVLSSRARILEFAAAAKHLLADREALASPSFFLASIEPRSWIPRIVGVFRGDRVRGMVYAKERKFIGIPTGLMYVDATLDHMVVAERGEATQVLKTAVTHILRNPRIQGLRLLVSSDHPFLLSVPEIRATVRMDVHCREIRKHCVLKLEDRYETFVNRFGSTTRRNFRYYRRRSESAGIVFVPAMRFDDFRAAAVSLLKKGVVGAQFDKLNRALDMLSVADRSMLVGLRDAEGNWLAVLGGWYESDRAVIFCQMNDDVGHPQSSLCTVLRGYLFEMLIEQGCAEVLFWDGIGGPLQRQSEFPPTTAVYFDRSTLIWRSVRSAIETAVRFLPKRASRAAQWVSPTMPPKSEE